MAVITAVGTAQELLRPKTALDVDVVLALAIVALGLRRSGAEFLVDGAVVILGNDVPGGCAGYLHCVVTDRPAAGAGVQARRWVSVRVSESQWLASALTIGVVILTMTAGSGIHQRGPRQLVALLVCIPVVLLRRWPLSVLAVVAAATGLIAARGSASLPFGVLLGVAFYLAALGLPRTRSIALALAAAGAVGLAVLYSALEVRTAQISGELVEYLVPLAGAWFIADSVTARHRYEAGLAAQAERERTAEIREERVRIAREMHDVVAHALAVITVQAGVGRCLAEKNPQEASAALGSIETIGRTAQDELRVVLGLLRDEEDGNVPLAPTPRLIDVEDLVETMRASGLLVDLRVSGADRGLSPSLELSIYRVVQEALTNVVKHAPGARVLVELAVSAGNVGLIVRDDGGRRAGPGRGPGHGILGMRERIGAFGGWLVVEPVAGGGFQVAAEVPIEGQTM